MKVEVTCMGCGQAAAIPVEKTLPLCAKCVKAAQKESRGVRHGKPAKPAEQENPPVKGK